MDDEEEKPAARARSGVKPVAKAKTGIPSARVRWADAIQAKVKEGMKRPDAIMAADIANPGLRAAMVAEANQRA